MNVIKKFVVWLFDIKPEDFVPVKKSSQFSDEAKELIRNEVKKYLDQAIPETVIPETRKAILNQISGEVPSIVVEEIQDGNSDALNEFPEIIEDSNLDSKPIMEEAVSSPEISSTDEEQSPEEIFPLEEIEFVEPVQIPQDIPRVVPIFDKEIRLGIDFGTTTTSVSIRIGDEEIPRALPIGSDGITTYIPSVVFIRPGEGNLEDRILVGEEAEAANDGKRIIHSVKRCFACHGENCKDRIGDDDKQIPFCNGDGRLRIGENEIIDPVQVAGFIVQEALERAFIILHDQWNINLDALKISITPVNFGCGANFNLDQRNIILEIAKESGFQNITIDNIVEEPILAGFAFSHLYDKPEGRSLIFDFGGGTLDIAIIDVDNSENNRLVTVLATAGDNWLGGNDIDRLVNIAFLHQIETVLNINQKTLIDQLEAIDKIKLRQMAKKAKERLSDIDLFEDVMFLEQLGTIPIKLSRDQFEEILTNSDILEKTQKTMLRALKLAYALDIAKESNLLDVSEISRLTLEGAVNKVTRIVLVGGVTKIPIIKKWLTDLFGNNKVIRDKVIEPISAVVIGAAYPREANHFSIATPSYGFYLEYTQNSIDKNVRKILLVKPFEYLEFYKMLHASTIPSYGIPIKVNEEWNSVNIMGKEAGKSEVEKIHSLGNLHPGNHQFHIRLDGSLVWLDEQMKPFQLGEHRFTHPLQKKISEWRIIRYKEEYEKDQKTREQELMEWRSGN